MVIMLPNQSKSPCTDSLQEELGAYFAGNSLFAQELRKQLTTFANCMLPLLITGKSGVGKTTAAKYAHTLSTYKNNSLIILRGSTYKISDEELQTIAAIPTTVIIRDIDLLSLPTQHLLYQTIISSATSARFIALSQTHLFKLVEQGAFNQDLFYTLNVVPLEIPTLQHRKEDICDIAAFFLKQLAAQTNYPDIAFSADALDLLTSYQWPENCHSLKQFVFHVLQTNAHASNSLDAAQCQSIYQHLFP